MSDPPIGSVPPALLARGRSRGATWFRPTETLRRPELGPRCVARIGGLLLTATMAGGVGIAACGQAGIEAGASQPRPSATPRATAVDQADPGDRSTAGERPGESGEAAAAPDPPGDEPIDAAESERLQRAEASAAVLALDGSRSTSTGHNSNGDLRGAVPFPDRATGVRLNPRRPNEAGRYTSVETAQALIRAAAVVAEDLPGSELVINDLSLESGGPIPHHGSHQNGRDVDVLFYLLNQDDTPFGSKGIPLDRSGRGFDFADVAVAEDDVAVKLDVARTWRFLQALAEDPRSNLQRIYLAEHLRNMLLAHAERIGAPAAARRRIDDGTCQPGHPHDDHLHLRFFCTPEDLRDGCEDTFPMYPWRRDEIRSAGLEPVMARWHPRRPTPQIVSRREAQERSGPMHANVRAFLRERESWSETPHPGRTYCR